MGGYHVTDGIDASLELKTRRIALEMGNPPISEREWGVFFGRCPGATSELSRAKMLYAHSAARLLAKPHRPRLVEVRRPGLTFVEVLLAWAAILIVYLPLCLYFDRSYVPRDPNVIHGPFINLAENAWIYYPIEEGTKTADTVDEPTRSRLWLYENDRPLGPPHAAHGEIAAAGGGQYSHWYNGKHSIVFSTSDNSDPNTNGRTYRVIDYVPPDPTVMYGRFIHLAGNAWIYYPIQEGKETADTVDEPTRSLLRLYENDRPLGPPHAAHHAIAAAGGGQYSHWYNGKNTIVFSTSDNSDPNTNGRIYRMIDSKAASSSGAAEAKSQ